MAQIAKSIIFRRAADNAPVLVIASGTNRVDEAKVSAQVGALAKADAKFVRDMTGYAIGGVCPIGHAVKLVMLLTRICSSTTACGPPPGIRMRCST